MESWININLNETQKLKNTRRYHVGRELLELEQYEAAIEQFKLMGQSERKNRAYDVACKLFERDLYQESFGYFEIAMDNGVKIEYPYKVACKLLDYKKYEKAILFFDLVYYQGEKLPYLFYNKRGNAHFHNKDYDKAKYDLITAIEENHATDSAYYCLAIIYEKTNQQDKALSCYNTIDEARYGEDTSCLLNRGAYYCRQKNHIKGIADFTKVIDAPLITDSPSQINMAYIMRGDAITELKHYGFALHNFYILLERNPDDQTKKVCHKAIFEILSDIQIHDNLNGITPYIMMETIKKLPDEQAFAVFNACLLNEESALGLFMKKAGYLDSNNNWDIRVAISKELSRLAKNLGFEYDAPDHVKIMSQTTITSQAIKSATELWTTTSNFFSLNFSNPVQPVNNTLDEKSRLQLGGRYDL